MERISVLICNKDYGLFLKRSINSAIFQKRKPNIICIVDDFSSDNSWDIISEFAKQNQVEDTTHQTPNGDVLVKIGYTNGIKIIGIRLPVSVGPSAARNNAIEYTINETDFYAILDADDEMWPSKLCECMKPFSNPNIGLVYANYEHIYEDSDVRLTEVKEPYDVFRLYSECIVHSGFVVRSEVLKKIKDQFGIYDATMRTCEDWDLEIRASKVCLFHHVPQVLTSVLVHQHNSTNSVQKQIWEANWQRIRQKHFGG